MQGKLFQRDYFPRIKAISNNKYIERKIEKSLQTSYLGD